MGGGEREKESEGWTEMVQRDRERERERERQRERERESPHCRAACASVMPINCGGGCGEGGAVRRCGGGLGVGEPDKPENALSQSLVAGLDFTRITQSRKAHLSNTNAPRPPRSCPPPGLVSVIAHPGIGQFAPIFTPAGPEKVVADTSGLSKEGRVCGRAAGRVGQHR